MGKNQAKIVIKGLGFGQMLFLVFLVLKLTKVISWSWWWVTSPLWLPMATVITAAIIFLAIVVIATVISS